MQSHKGVLGVVSLGPGMAEDACGSPLNSMPVDCTLLWASEQSLLFTPQKRFEPLSYLLINILQLTNIPRESRLSRLVFVPFIQSGPNLHLFFWSSLRTHCHLYNLVLYNQCSGKDRESWGQALF